MSCAKHRKDGWAQRLLIATAIGLCVAGLWSQAACAAEAEEETTPRAARTTVRKTAGAVEQSKLDKKLQQILDNQDKILANQQTILGKFDAVMDELRIIKVRSIH